jgi:hypothetical protein
MRSRVLRRLAHILILLAMGIYAFSALFLNFYEGRSPRQQGITYFDVLTLPDRRTALAITGAILTAFGGPFLIAVLCLRELAGRWPDLSRYTLVVAVATWGSFVVGSTLQVRASGLAVGAGYRVQVLSTVLAIAGAIVLLITPHRRAPLGSYGW